MVTQRQRRLLITGASRGIGLALTRRRLARGDQVVGLSRNPPKSSLGADFEHIALDLGDRRQLDGDVRRIFRAQSAGERSFDAIVSNAGSPALGGLEEFGSSAIERALTTNLTSHILLARHALPQLAPGSHLIFVGSVAALEPGRRGTVYCAAKAGLAGFVAALRQECSGRGIHVGIVHPGMVRTDFHDGQVVGPGPAPDHALAAEDVAIAIETMLDARDGAVVDEIRIRPRKHVLEFTKRRSKP